MATMPRSTFWVRIAASLLVLPLTTCLAADPLSARNWLPRNGSPTPRDTSNGVRFTLPFNQSATDRVYWDVPISLDLAKLPLLEMDFECDRPEAIRSAILYFRSSEGWYLSALSISRAGPQKLWLDSGQFEKEGRPGSLSAIQALRLSFWRGQSVNASFILRRIQPVAPVVAVLGPDQSHCDPLERAFAEKLVKYHLAWLNRIGLPAVAVRESAIHSTSLPRVLMLPYNPTPPDTLRSRLLHHIERGGRLIVCYSADEQLARAMGVRLRAYQALSDGESWNGLRPRETPAARTLPPWVGQVTRQWIPAEPHREDVEVLADWYDATGRVAPAPAILLGPAGVWATYVLNSDDGPNKSWLLGSLVATLDPSVWPNVARAAIEQASRVDSFQSLDESIQCIARMAPPGRAEAVRQHLDRARYNFTTATRAAQGNSWAEALRAAHQLHTDLTKAYAAAQTPRPNERLGVWDHSGLGLYPGDWDRTARELAAAGVTDLFVNFLWPYQAHYPSEVAPVSYIARRYGDQLAACLEAAQRYGLRLHVWKVCWNAEGAPKAMRDSLRQQGRLQRSADGDTIAWLDPTVPENVERELAGLLEVVRRYPVHGVHLDYIRFPGRSGSFSDQARIRFERALGRQVQRWPADVTHGGPLEDEFLRWRADWMSQIVRQWAQELRQLRPGILVSAAVFPDPTDAPRSVGQDWPRWLQKRWVDFVCPMNYEERLNVFTARCATHMALPGASGRVWEGIGVSASASQLTADQVIEQYLRARAAGAAGVVLFDLNPLLRDQILPFLSMGLTASTPAR